MELKHDEARQYAREHVRLAGNAVQGSAAGVLLRTGALEETEAALQLIMRAQGTYFEWVPIDLARAQMWQGKYDEAYERFADAYASGLKAPGDRRNALLGMAYILVKRGNVAAAREKVAAFLAEEESHVPRTRTRMQQIDYFMWSDQEMITDYLDALVAAGLPEE